MLKPVRKGLAEDEDGNSEVSSSCCSGGVTLFSSLYMSCILVRNIGRQADQNRWSSSQQQSRGRTCCGPQSCASKAELAPAVEVLCFDSAMLH